MQPSSRETCPRNPVQVGVEMFHPGWEETIGSTDYIWPQLFIKYSQEEIAHHKGRNTNISKANKSLAALRPAAICFAFLSLQLNIKITGSHSSNISTAVPYLHYLKRLSAAVTERHCHISHAPYCLLCGVAIQFNKPLWDDT